MIVGAIENWQTERKRMHPVIRETVDFLKETDFGGNEDGLFPIRGEAIQGRLMTLSSKAAYEQPAEKHERFADVHYLLEGHETIGWQPNVESLKPTQAYNAEQDFALYEVLPHESSIRLRRGTYAVFLPDDIHRPGLGDRPGDVIRKIVIKIDMSLL
ncbi:YhcH/YjgK/YiaL family protein [Cohnella sp. GCM10012308]|uniref:YhcH/YjgK/YiaL family protein n=1 Tax=Cohnella sp. GCM10012308 TaxID=3317329 RepID=UPI003614CE62